MIDRFDIFKKLAEYESEPPAGALNSIFKVLDAGSEIADDNDLKGSMVQLHELDIAPPSDLISLIDERIAYPSQFPDLKDFEINPPVGAFSDIVKKIQEENNIVKPATKIFSLNFYKVAAASALFIITASVIFILSRPAGKTVIDVAGKKVDPVVNTNDTVKINNIASVKAKPTINHHKIVRQVVSDDYFYTPKASIGDYNFPVVNNDLLATFASFNYSNVPEIINDQDAKSFRIQIDQYSGITVSENMSAMMKRMNQFRHNHKLTNRAKRARAKLERWKKADEARFDKSLINNPVDPIDLAEFIFN